MNTIELRPHQIEDWRNRQPVQVVRVRQIPPLKRPASSDDNAEAMNILRQAPMLVANALRRGAIKITFANDGAKIPDKHVHGAATRRRMSIAKKKTLALKQRNKQTTQH